MWPRKKSASLTEVLRRYKLGSAAYRDLVPPLADELSTAGRKGNPLAATVLHRYAGPLYAETAKVLGAAPVPVWSDLLAPDGRIAADDRTHPVVPLMSEHYQEISFNQYRLGDPPIHPYIHLTAAARAITAAGDAREAGADGALADRAWFVLAFWVNIGLGYGKAVDRDAELIGDLIDCCARVAELTGTAVPAFVPDAVDRDLLLRRYVREWVTTDRYVDEDGQVIDSGHPEVWDSGLAIPLGTLLRWRFGGANPLPSDPGAAMDYARAKAEAGDFGAARAALTAAEATAAPDQAARISALLHDVVAEHACRELVTILVQYRTEQGSPERARVREIGENLYRTGGMALMREVHTRFTASQPTHARSLDMLWHEIGDWQG